ncbi:hypothetical protein ACFVDN_17430 [Streptomyces californicus]|uniref:hypothetical protein n=1 Tax=Streptomyces californicus TaxID=67351 RepID=UPI00368AD0B0
MQDFDPVRIGRRRGKVLEVQRDDGMRMTADRGRQNVPVLVVVRHDGHERFMPRHHAFRKRSRHGGDEVLGLEIADALSDVPGQLVKDSGGPERLVQLRLRQPEQGGVSLR